jgi:hypothetical protein
MVMGRPRGTTVAAREDDRDDDDDDDDDDDADEAIPTQRKWVSDPRA